MSRIIPDENHDITGNTGTSYQYSVLDSGHNISESNNPSLWKQFIDTIVSLPLYISELFNNKKFLLIFYSICLLISSVGNSIYSKKMTNHMLNYPYFISQLTTLVYLPIFGGVVLYEIYFTDFITPEQFAFPKYKFLVMGTMDSIAGVFQLFGGVYTSGNTQGLLNQAVVPVTMIMAYFILKTRYKPFQIIGASVIIAGVLTVILPKFLFPNPSDNDGTPDKPLFNIIFLISILPMAFSTIYKEIAFNDIELDVNYLQYWVAVCQFFFGFLLIPINTLDFFGPNAVPWNKLPSALWNGMLCLYGINSVTTGCGPSPIAIPCDDCQGAWLPLTIYLIFNCSFNVFIMLLIKYGSATVLYIIMTLRLPIVNFAFSMSFIEDPPEPFDIYTIIGLIVIIAGLVAYRYGSASSEEGGESGDDPIGINERGLIFAQPKRVKPKAAIEIRSNFYSKLGVISSPRTSSARNTGTGVNKFGHPNI